MTVPTASPAGRRQQQREQTRSRILDAAIRHFALHGYDGTSLADIARGAGVKKALVQYHFPSKDLLWKSAVDALWQRRNQDLSDYRPGGSPQDQSALLHAILGEISAFTQAHPQWLQILFNEAATPGPRLQWLVDRHLQEDFGQGLAFIRHAQHDGLMPACNPLDLLLILSGALSYLFLVAPVTLRVTGEDFTQAATLQRYIGTLNTLLQKAGQSPA